MGKKFQGNLDGKFLVYIFTSYWFHSDKFPRKIKNQFNSATLKSKHSQYCLSVDKTYLVIQNSVTSDIEPFWSKHKKIYYSVIIPVDLWKFSRKIIFIANEIDFDSFFSYKLLLCSFIYFVSVLVYHITTRILQFNALHGYINGFIFVSFP